MSTNTQTNASVGYTITDKAPVQYLGTADSLRESATNGLAKIASVTNGFGHSSFRMVIIGIIFLVSVTLRAETDIQRLNRLLVRGDQKLTQGYKDYNSKTQRPYHVGEDFRARSSSGRGVSIYSPVSGTIYAIHDCEGMLSIRPDYQPERNRTVYFLIGHLASYDDKFVKSSKALKGTRVNVGDRLGISGTKLCKGSVELHVHVEVRKGDGTSLGAYQSSKKAVDQEWLQPSRFVGDANTAPMLKAEIYATSSRVGVRLQLGDPEDDEIEYDIAIEDEKKKVWARGDGKLDGGKTFEVEWEKSDLPLSRLLSTRLRARIEAQDELGSRAAEVTNYLKIKK